MKTLVIAFLVTVMAIPATAAVIWDEDVNGDLSSNEAAPTPIPFPFGASIIKGKINGNPLDRDYITFTVPADHTLSSMSLLVFQPNNLAFMSLNAGSTSYIPSASTNDFFLSGIHFSQNDLFPINLMEFFATRSVTTNALPSPSLGPGTYSWLIQQTSPVLQTYWVEFILSTPLATEPSTWGKVKALYR
jgi:hypothetical protein